MTRLRPSIRLRLTAWYAAIFFALGAVLLASSYAIVRHEFSRETERLHVQIDAPPLPGSTGASARVRIAPGLPPLDEPEIQQMAPAERAAYARALSAYRNAAGDANDRALRNVLIAFVALLVLMTFVSIVAGWIVAGRALRPIAKITAAARRMSDRTLHERIALEGPRDELHELADTFDTMLGRLEQAFASRERFVSSASHELLTPIAIIRAELDVTLSDPNVGERELRDMALVVGETNERMERLIGSLLTLASSEAGITRHRPADLADAAGAALATAVDSRCDEDAPRLDVYLQPAPVLGDAVLLEQVASNLVQNALRYNVPYGRVEVRTMQLGGRSVLEVGNTGPCVRAEDVASLTEPFHRLETSRSRATGGYGLGLAVARAVVAAHGGGLAIAARPAGGLDVRVTLPAADRVRAGDSAPIRLPV